MPRLPAAAVFALLTGASTMAQVFRAGTDVVPVYVAVTLRDGTPVTDLRSDEFSILDDGKPTAVTQFSNTPTSIAVEIVLDTSGSMAGSVNRMLTGALALVEGLRPDDRVGLRTLTRDVAPLNADKIELRKALQSVLSNSRTVLGEGSEIHRGFAAGIETVSKLEGRRAALLITDGGETGTSVTFARAGQDDVVLYAIGFGDRKMDPVFAAEVITSGGVVGVVPSTADVSAVFADLAKELHQEYLLGFVPARFDGKSHRLQVQVSRPGVTVRARKRYIAAQR